MKNNKQLWLGILILITAVITFVALLKLSTTDKRNNDFKPTAYIENVFDTTVADKFAVVFYKPGCPYCEAAKNTVLELAPDAKIPVYYINTQSEMGKKLIPIAKIKYASTIAVFDFENKNQLPISQILFANNSKNGEAAIERWSYADSKDGEKVALPENIKKAFEIE